MWTHKIKIKKITNEAVLASPMMAMTMMTQTTTMGGEQLRRMCNAETDERQMATNAQKD